MKLSIYNTLTRQKEDVTPITGDVVRIYSCGLTVYDYAHIGNLRKYIFDDLLVRSLKYFGYKVKHIQNVTDVGHLVSDEDEGEDKIEKGSAREGKSAQEIARFFEAEFIKDLKKLKIEIPDLMPRATENIKEQIDLIKVLEEKGFTYQTSDGVYFDTSKLSDYGKLAKLDIENLEEGSRVEKNPEKKNITDFALWKFSPEGAKRQQQWESPWGVGFPGWHLECSAMATKFLGQPFEIHTGGVDHIPVHHTNEIAQSEAAYDKPLAKYWVHSEHLLENGRKMAKSDGHFIRLKDLEEKGYSPLDFRYLCLTASYRSKLDFSWNSLDGAVSARKKIINAYMKAGDEDISLDGFDEAVLDDLDTSKALAFIFENLNKLSKENFEKIDEVLAILEKIEIKEESGITTEGYVPQDVFKLALERQKAREQKDFAKSDELRDKIFQKGFLIEDSSSGVRIRKR